MLRASHVQIHRQPLLQQLGVGEARVVVRIDVAQIVPAGTRPLRHRVRLALALPARGRIGDVHPILRLRKRRLARSRRLVVLKLRQGKRKVAFIHKRLRAVFPVNDRERLAPVALTREEPVAELVLRLGLADALGFQPFDHLLLRILHRKPCDEPAVHHHAIRNIGIGHLASIWHTRGGRDALLRVRSRRGLRPSPFPIPRSLFPFRHHLIDRQIEDLREIEVALIMRRHGHDRARAVGGEHIVGDEDRDLVAVHGIYAHHACQTNARLLLVQLRALKIALGGGLPLIRLHLVGVVNRPICEPFRDQRMLRRQHHVCRPEERVAPCGEYGDGISPTRPTSNHPEIHQRARGFADPVALHLLDALGPVKLIEIRKQPLRVSSDLQHPLTHRTPLNGMIAALGAPIDHLFVREHRPERRTPVHRHLGHVGKALLVQLLEDPLRPPVVLRICRVHLAVPVVGESEHPDLLTEAVDVLLGGDGGMRSRLHGVLLGRQSKGVPPHRMKNIKPFHPLVAAEDIGRGVALRMTDVKPHPGRIRKHVKAIELLLLVVARVALECLVLEPVCLPFLLDGGKVVVHFFFVPLGSRTACMIQVRALIVEFVNRHRAKRLVNGETVDRGAIREG